MTNRPAIIELVAKNRLAELCDEIEGFPYFPNAACIGEDPDFFFPDDMATTVKAKAVCAACPVQKDCLATAVSQGLEGVWGGTTETERASLTKARDYTLPTRQAARQELRYIYLGEVNKVAASYDVDRRTVHRWRNIIEDNPLAYELAA